MNVSPALNPPLGNTVQSRSIINVEFEKCKYKIPIVKHINKIPPNIYRIDIIDILGGFFK